MENREEVLNIEPAAWSQEVESCFFGKVPHVPVSVAQKAVEEGGALFRVSRGGALVGFYILTIEGRDGVLFLGVGADEKTDLTAAIVPTIERQFVGCEAIRIHTRRPGLAKKLAAMGYQPEMVLRKPLCN